MGVGDRHSPEHLIEPITWREGEHLVPWVDADAALSKAAMDRASAQSRVVTLDQAIQEGRVIERKMGGNDGY